MPRLLFQEDLFLFSVPGLAKHWQRLEELLHVPPVSLCHASPRLPWGKHPPLLPCSTERSFSDQNQPVQSSVPHLLLATCNQSWRGCLEGVAPRLTPCVLQRNDAEIGLRMQRKRHYPLFPFFSHRIMEWFWLEGTLKIT